MKVTVAPTKRSAVAVVVSKPAVTTGTLAGLTVIVAASPVVEPEALEATRRKATVSKSIPVVLTAKVGLVAPGMLVMLPVLPPSVCH